MDTRRSKGKCLATLGHALIDLATLGHALIDETYRTICGKISHVCNVGWRGTEEGNKGPYTAGDDPHASI